MYLTYNVFMTVFPAGDFRYVFSGRLRVKSLSDYDKQLTLISNALNKNSVYKFKVVSCYEKDKNKQQKLPF